MLRRMLFTAACALLWLIVAGGAISFGFFYTTTPTRWYQVRATELITWRNTLILQYNFANATTGRATPLLSGGYSFLLIWQWCGTLAVALGSAGLLWLSSITAAANKASMSHPPKPVKKSASGLSWSVGAAARKAVIRVRRLLRYQVPPRGLWRSIRGPEGLSVLDLLLVLLWLGLHILWLREMTMRVLDSRRAAPPPPKAAKKLKPLPEVVQDSVAKYSGWVGRLDILLLFFPLPRCNFLHWLLGSDFASMVKYHRWLGQGTLLVYSLHGITYLSIWAHSGVLSTMLDWNMGAGVNRLSGLVAMCGGWLLCLTSLSFVRRRFYSLFYSCHILGATMFLLFGFMHRKDVATWVMPGIFLYLVDVVLRTLQQNFNGVKMKIAPAATGAEVNFPFSSTCAAVARLSSPNGGELLSLSIRCHESIHWVGGDTVFLNVPAVSWFQWHPFTIASEPSAANIMELKIKKYNRWTKALISRVSSDPLALYVSGPYDNSNRKWMKKFDTHVFVAGGVGITPALGMILELLAARRQQPAGKGSNADRIILVWVSRTMDELRALPYEILQAASDGVASGVDLYLHLTSSTAAPDGKHSQAAGVTTVAAKAAADGKASLEGTAPPGSGSRSSNDSVMTPQAIGEGLSGAKLPSGDEDAFGGLATAARPLSHPYMFSPLLWMAAVVLSFTGGFAGLMCSQAYDAHLSRTVTVRNDFSFVGMMQFAALGLGSTLPPAVLMLGAHLWRRLARPITWASFRTTASSFRSSNDQAVSTAIRTSLDDAPKKASFPTPAKALTSYIKYGRPDLLTLLHQVAMTGGIAPDVNATGPTSGELLDANFSSADLALEELRVAVYAAGPEPLVGTVSELCASLNGLWGRKGRAYLHFKSITHEL
ncbi:ferric-chelate reductase [Volvox carteri f. nagariensis]|uniref:Ferric-chelate reductase n=1 Tax=Volvox carteri f. nagariensis TaxID=3068 RepID=D8TZX8_VOLCA|nr:ferric-chelate reductase [Volvox carteri f. nagariensis]EFJ47088.1 ferric-chelate reductase [Volvox carteri f. nagariensis]|eukprot:XP_002951983.1 ferric-chelate reductase [Volvox carteri f. nagariensis]